MSRTREGGAAYTSRSGRKWILFKDNKDVRKRIWHLVDGKGKVVRKKTGAVNVGGNIAEATRRSESAFRSAAKTTSGRGAGRSAFSTRPPKKNKKVTSPDATEGPPDDKDERLRQISQLKIKQGNNNTDKEAPNKQVSSEETQIQKESNEKKKELTAAEKEAKDRSDWLKRTANSPAAKAWGNSKEANEKRWQLQKEHRKWLAGRRKKKPDEDKNKNGKH